jgi:hypothetical protein
VVKRARHNQYRIKHDSDTGTRHTSPPTITLIDHHHNMINLS